MRQEYGGGEQTRKGEEGRGNGEEIDATYRADGK